MAPNAHDINFLFGKNEVSKIREVLLSNYCFLLENKIGAKYYSYGTAGFRCHNSELIHVMLLCGIYTATLSKVLTHLCNLESEKEDKIQGTEEAQNFSEKQEMNEEKVIQVGAMITASHNAAEDNGIKIIMHNGDMLPRKLEGGIENFVNSARGCKSADEWVGNALNILLNLIKNDFSSFAVNECKIINKELEKEEMDWKQRHSAGHKVAQEMKTNSGKVHFKNGNNYRSQDKKLSKVILGYDTRKSSYFLKNKFIEGLLTMSAQLVDIGECTTPQIHFITKHLNYIEKKKIGYKQFYFDYFNQNFNSLIEVLKENSVNKKQEVLYVDCANGVGAKEMLNFFETLKKLNIKLEIINDGKNFTDVLNFQCGAEFLQKEQKLPKNFYENEKIEETSRCCSLDGDADRLVYFSFSKDLSKINNENSESDNTKAYKVQVLDGNRIASLFAYVFVKSFGHIFRENKKQFFKKIDVDKSLDILKIGIIQTAYANGNSTAFLKKIIKQLEEENQEINKIVEISVCTAKTGVKYLHAESKNFDIGIYFEANGHGTVVHKFYNPFYKWRDVTTLSSCKSFKFLENFIKLFNETVGDALTDLLAVEVTLKHLKFSFDDWLSMYEDLPCLTTKMYLCRSVLNKFKPNENETFLIEPKLLQKQISSAVCRYTGGRAFVRASGTEDVCRIYVEAPTLEKAKKLSSELHEIIQNFVNCNDL